MNLWRCSSWIFGREWEMIKQQMCCSSVGQSNLDLHSTVNIVLRSFIWRNLSPWLYALYMLFSSLGRTVCWVFFFGICSSFQGYLWFIATDPFTPMALILTHFIQVYCISEQIHGVVIVFLLQMINYVKLLWPNGFYVYLRQWKNQVSCHQRFITRHIYSQEKGEDQGITWQSR